MKKIITIIIALALVAAFAISMVACDSGKTASSSQKSSFKPIAAEKIKLGLITLHGEESTYDKNFIDAAKAACTEMGVQIVVKSGIAESNACYEAACELVDDGCNIIFADSFGHEAYLLKAAKKYPNVRFAHATGTTAHTELQANFYNAFASIYEGRYLAGIAAGMKLNAMGETKMGYVGAYPYAEVLSGLTSFYLGAKSVCSNVTMDVQFTNSWYDVTAENETALSLIDRGCKLISQHADSMGAPNACKSKNVPNVTYNVSTIDTCATTYLIGSKINWKPYFKHLITCTINGVTAVGFDWCGGIATGSVELTGLNAAVAAPGTQEAIDEAIAKFNAGTLKVFDTNTFTVSGGKKLTYVADVDSDAAFAGDTQVIITENGITYFNESAYRSAPYFDLKIDGITFLN